MEPATQYFSRLAKSVGLDSGAPGFGQLTRLEATSGNIRAAVYCDDGSLFAVANAGCVRILNPDSQEVIQTLDVKDAIEIGFSPKGTYLLTWERPKKDEESGNFLPNLRVWNIRSGEMIDEFNQKSQGAWSLQYSFDEKYAARQVSPGLIQFYDAKNLCTPTSKLQIEDGISQFSMSPGQNYSIAVYIPEKKGKPGCVRVYQIPSFAQPVSQKTFFKAEKVQMKWNKLGTALLVLTSTDVDHSGRSYYGETNLYLLGIAGSYDSRIQLNREGTIHDFAWSPDSREFGVVYGFMPAKTTIFDSRGNEIHSLPLAPRNTIMFSPHARFIAVGGFGNLQGTMNIYDRQKKFALVATIEAANTSACEWSPDGCFILTATTSPRLRVDNGVKIWHYTGKLVYQREHDELFAASWRPQSVESFPLRAGTPAPEPHESVVANGQTQAPAATKPSGAYRPPHARGNGDAAAPTSLFQRAAMHAVGAPSSGITVRLPPGAAPAQPALSKSAEKRKKKKENSATSRADNATNSGTEASREGTPTAQGAGAGPTGSTPEEKKIRGLLKKLRAIEDLKVRQANGDKLEDTQVQKISTENSVRADLAKLGWSG